MKTKKFDLKAAMAGDKLVTRDGRNVQYVAYLPQLPYPIIALIEGENTVSSYSPAGVYCGADLSEEPEDLFMVVTTKVVYANLYSDGSWYQHTTKTDAENLASPTLNGKPLVIALPIEIEV